ncbi:unnamed protein product [Trichogramma brassicae]|uniref:Uncharacterized protein n=1 Tax=Trichogramma brassicae TaxID=86971 RepID=A0A6H5ISP4_9HYME|nr:unnamed protein product [Trichogramma brassicae]
MFAPPFPACSGEEDAPAVQRCVAALDDKKRFRKSFLYWLMDVIPRHREIHHQMILSLSRLRCSARLNCLADLSDSTSDWDSDPATDGAPESGAVGVADPAAEGVPSPTTSIASSCAFKRSTVNSVCELSHTRIFSRQRSRNGSGHLRRAVIAVTESIHSNHLGNIETSFTPESRQHATHIIEHAIYTKDDAPINARPYRFPAALREELHRQVNEMLETGIIEASESSYRSNIFLVPKTT